LGAATQPVPNSATWYLELEEIQRDLDLFVAYYNLDRSHQAYRLRGRTLAEALREALGVERIPELVVLASSESQTYAAEETIV
jgi:hypothetical protein